MSTKFKVLLLNGPNLNMLGKREPNIYGSQTLGDVVTQLEHEAVSLNVELMHVQSNAEHELIEAIHLGHEQVDYIIINPAAYTHTSVAIRDALLAINVPFIEVHLSNVHAREDFRKHSYFSDIAQGVICGLGVKGYSYALNFVHTQLTT
jgi:3-dehydroquinate dehydratase-2